MLDKIVIVNRNHALIIFTDKAAISLYSDRDVREVLYWFCNIHLRLANDDITQKIYLDVAS